MDSDKKKRDWTKIAEEDIDILWNSCDKEMDKYKNWFRFI